MYILIKNIFMIYINVNKNMANQHVFWAHS
jgi:hypothetical protein